MSRPSEKRPHRAAIRATAILLAASAAGVAGQAAADESGASFWLPGQYASFAAVQADPGWSLTTTYYHQSAGASASRGLARGRTAEVDVRSRYNLLLVDVLYVPEAVVLGGQLAVGLSAFVGNNRISAAASVSGPGGTISGKARDSVAGLGDLYPIASLRWEAGVHNFMVYGTAGIPAGAYSSDRLAGLGIGHWAADAGGAYTFWHEATGLEFSALVGFTYNFTNPDTNYRSGIDAHLDWGASWSPRSDLQIGLVGYVYRQITADSGSGATFGAFRSRVIGIGPQIGLSVPIAGKDVEINVRGYHEFAARHRLEGWNLWVAVSLQL